jgi:hypothetical protein
LVEREGRRDVLGRDPPDREADVHEHVVADGDGLVHDRKGDLAADAPEVDGRHEIAHRDDPSGSS